MIASTHLWKKTCVGKIVGSVVYSTARPNYEGEVRGSNPGWANRTQQLLSVIIKKQRTRFLRADVFEWATLPQKLHGLHVFCHRKTALQQTSAGTHIFSIFIESSNTGSALIDGSRCHNRIYHYELFNQAKRKKRAPKSRRWKIFILRFNLSF